MSTETERGIIYVATGRKYRLEANGSASSVRKVMPDANITIYTDIQADLDTKLFDAIEILGTPAYSFFDKITPLCDSPYQRTLFLDTDTIVLDPVYELFDVLDQFDLTYCHAPNRGADSPKMLSACPMAFVEPNTGVMSYIKTDKVIALFKEWANYYRNLLAETPVRVRHDQPALRKVLYHSDVRVLVLPPEYNLRTVFPMFKGSMPAKILHGRDPTLSRALEAMRQNYWMGIYDFRDQSRLWWRVQRKFRNIVDRLR